MDSSKAKEIIEDLFPEDITALNEGRADVLLEYAKPKLEAYLEEIAPEIYEGLSVLQGSFDAHSQMSETEHSNFRSKIDESLKKLATVERLQTKLDELGERVTSNRKDLLDFVETSSKSSKEIAYRAIGLINDLSAQLPDLKSDIDRAFSKIEGIKPFNDKDIWKELEELRKLFLAMPRGGGGAYRNIAVGGNSSVLSRYNDLNIKAGANVTLTYTNNNTTKFVDLTVTSSGGGGSVIGTTRSINTISTSQSAGSTSNTDYVYICAAGIQVTLPDPSTNTNLYTIKNTSNSSVLVTPFAAETIDGSSNLILATRYTSVDLVSDTTNWEIT